MGGRVRMIDVGRGTRTPSGKLWPKGTVQDAAADVQAAARGPLPKAISWQPRRWPASWRRSRPRACCLSATRPLSEVKG